MNQATRAHIGRSGEILVFTYFSGLGSNVVLSEDEYDDSKDMTIDGISAEVKTQTLYRDFHGYGPAFTISLPTKTQHLNQYEKCQNVDRLFFVKRSSKQDLTVKIFEAPEKENRKFLHKVNFRDSREVAAILTKDLIEIKSYTNKKIVEHFMEKERTYA